MSKKNTWFIAVEYADDDVDIVRSMDYDKAIKFAELAWADALADLRETGEQGVLGVLVFDDSGRIIWQHDNPLGRTGYFDRLGQRGKGTGPAQGPVKTLAVAQLS